MDTDERPDLRRGGESKLLLKAETEKIIGDSYLCPSVVKMFFK